MVLTKGFTNDPSICCIGVSTEGGEFDSLDDLFQNHFTIIRGWIGTPNHDPSKIKIFMTFLFADGFFQTSEMQEKVQKAILINIDRISKGVGNSALAIFFTDTSKINYDEEKNLNYITHFGVESRKTPHIIITKIFPNEWKKGDDMIRITLNRIDVDKLGDVMGPLCDTLRSDESLSQRNLTFTTTWNSITQWFKKHKQDLKDGSEIASNILSVSKVLKK